MQELGASFPECEVFTLYLIITDKSIKFKVYKRMALFV